VNARRVSEWENWTQKVHCLCGSQDEKELVKCISCQHLLHASCIDVEVDKEERTWPVLCPQCWRQKVCTVCCYSAKISPFGRRAGGRDMYEYLPSLRLEGNSIVSRPQRFNPLDGTIAYYLLTPNRLFRYRNINKHIPLPDWGELPSRGKGNPARSRKPLMIM